MAAKTDERAANTNRWTGWTKSGPQLISKSANAPEVRASPNFWPREGDEGEEPRTSDTELRRKLDLMCFKRMSRISSRRLVTLLDMTSAPRVISTNWGLGVC